MVRGVLLDRRSAAVWLNHRGSVRPHLPERRPRRTKPVTPRARLTSPPVWSWSPQAVTQGG
ncbi:hypothetical protein BE11_14095 [Sorangium cellulosum]|nr:hypothetical protein BE11_14095 [Sorangium cellulosum]